MYTIQRTVQRVICEMTDFERLEALESKVFDLSQLVYSLASVSPELPAELRQKFKTKYHLNNRFKAERMFEITPEEDDQEGNQEQ